MAFEALKERQSIAWSSAPYEQVSEQHLSAIEALLDRLDLRSGQQLLDVATGTGELARPAAARGLEVTGVDFAERLIATARERTARERLDICFDVADCEHLPYDDASYDAVTSTFGVMFAPDHKAAAAELARVSKPGGLLGITAWTPDSVVAKMFAVMRPYTPQPPKGAGSPFAWGDPNHVQELLGDAFELEFEHDAVPQTGASGQALWELMSGSYGPTKTLAESLEQDRRASLQRKFAAFFDGYRTNGQVVLWREYLQILGRRRD
jgi:ubiquinone/menaquinone biosynthesis C-methylase UbiE